MNFEFFAQLIEYLRANGPEVLVGLLIGCILAFFIIYWIPPLRRIFTRGVEDKLWELKDRHRELEGERGRLLEDRRTLLADVHRHEELEKSHLRQRRRLGRRLKRRQIELCEIELSLKNALEQLRDYENTDQNLWTAAVRGEAARFVPRGERLTPIISLLNLKGGVGKTTITAYLAAALAETGRRTLCLDLDHQGSLANLCLPPDAQGQLKKNGLFLAALLQREADLAGHLRLMAAEARPGLHVVMAGEQLANVEQDLLANWHLGRAKRDARFLLRQALHDETTWKEFDVILLDCPPRLSAACINAVTASDFVMIPTLLERRSAESVPRLIRWLQDIRAAGSPTLQVLGVVASRVRLYGGRMTKADREVWEADLPSRCQAVDSIPVRFFSTFIHDNSSLQSFESRQTPQARKAKEQFAVLAEEVLRRLGETAAAPRQIKAAVPAE